MKAEKSKVMVPEIMKDLWLVALGTLSLAEEEIRNIVKQFTEKESISQEEGKKLLKDLMDKVKRNRTQLESKIGESVQKALEKLNVPSKEEIRRLSKKVDELSGRLETLKKMRIEKGEGRRSKIND